MTRLQERLLEAIEGTALSDAERLNRPGDARFLALRSPDAHRWCSALKARNCMIDVRGDVIRFGIGLYIDDEDIDRFAGFARELT